MALTTKPIVWRILGVIFVLLSLIFVMFFFFSTIFITFIFGFVLIFITEKLMNEYRDSIGKYRLKKWVRNLLGTGLVIFWTVVILLLLGQSVGQLANAIGNFKEGTSVTGTLYQNSKDQIPTLINKYVKPETFGKVESWIIGFFSNLLSSLSKFIANGILIIPLLFYFYFKKSHKLAKEILLLVPRDMKSGFQRGTRQIGRELHDFFAAKVIESTIVGCICCLGFYVAGLKGWLILGLLAGFLNIVPYIGPIIGAVPPLLFGLLDAPIVAVIVLITILVAQLIDSLYLIPFMISSKVKVDALLSIILQFQSI
jgi:predicted PurR-regulated permease PerM